MAVRGRVSGFANWRSNLARDWGSPFSQDGGKPTATVDLAKPTYRMGIAKVKVGWEGHKLGVAVKAEKASLCRARHGQRRTCTVKNPDGSPARERRCGVRRGGRGPAPARPQ